MSSEIISGFRTVTAQLTLRFALIFTLSSMAVFLFTYYNLTSNLDRELDETLRNKAEKVNSQYKEFGLAAMKEALNPEIESSTPKKMFFRIFSPENKVIATSNLRGWQGTSINTRAFGSLSKDGEAFRTVFVRGRLYKVRVIYKVIEDGYIVQIGYVFGLLEVIGKYGWIYITSMASMLVLGVFVGWIVVNRAMKGVKRVTRAAVRIGEGDFAQRLPMENKGEEIDDLARAFNEMLEKIEMLIGEIRGVTDNVAHDLRSPLNRIRGQVEMALTSDNGSEEWTETAGGVIEECDRLIGMINDMLEIAEANSGTFVKATARVDIMAIVSEAFELFQPVAEDEGIKLKIDSSPVSMITTGDLPRLQRTVANLLDNAIKYTPAGGTIRLSVRRNRDEFMVDVIDSGEGIREEDLPHIFNRFYRGDRSRSTPGHGLGLSLAQAIIRAHGGNLAVKSHPGQGSTFTVHIPRT